MPALLVLLVALALLCDCVMSGDSVFKSSCSGVIYPLSSEVLALLVLALLEWVVGFVALF